MRRVTLLLIVTVFGCAGNTASDSADTEATAGTDPDTQTSGSTTCGAGPWPDQVDSPWVASYSPTGEVALSGDPAVSEDGRYIASVQASDTGRLVISVYDAKCHTVEEIPRPDSELATDALSPQLSADGQTVVFVTRNTEMKLDIFVYDRRTQVIDPISVNEDKALGNMVSTSPSVTPDGRYVAFESNARLLQEDTDELSDIYVYDRNTNTMALASIFETEWDQSKNCARPTISADGRYVAFELNTVVYLRDLHEQTNELISKTTDGMYISGVAPSISADGRYVAYESGEVPGPDMDTNDFNDVYLFDRQRQITKRISVGAAGEELEQPSWGAQISENGARILFLSGVVGLAPKESAAQMYVKDVNTHVLTKLRITADGDAANRFISGTLSIAKDGKWAVFETMATNVVAGVTPSNFVTYAVGIPF